MLIPPQRAGMGKLSLRIVERRLAFAGGEVLGFVSAPDANTATVGWYLQAG